MAGIFEEIRTVLYPKKWDSWQALIWISIFSWAVSLLSAGLVQEIIATIAWIFLTMGVHWFVHDEGIPTNPKDDKAKINVKKGLTINNIFLGPWITGTLICLYLFGHLLGRFPPLAFIVWGPLSAVLAIIPKFIKLGPDGAPLWATPEPKARPGLVILILSNLLLSCWFQFYFATDAWLKEYPSLSSQDLGRSSFMVKVSAPRTTKERGVFLLEQAEENLRSDLGKAAWTQTQQWFVGFQQQFPQFRNTLFEQVADSQDKSLWYLDGRVLPDYSVQFYSGWAGPSAEAGGYHFTRTCKVTRIPLAKLNDPKAEVKCGPVTGPIPGLPDKTK
jgi:Family of unknown function (DUF5357)